MNDLREAVALEVVAGTDSRLINPKTVVRGADPWHRRGSEVSSFAAVEAVVAGAAVADDDEASCAVGTTRLADDLLEKSPPPDDISAQLVLFKRLVFYC